MKKSLEDKVKNPNQNQLIPILGVFYAIKDGINPDPRYMTFRDELKFLSYAFYQTVSISVLTSEIYSIFK